jgi:Na+-transporting NADH:ubiquinone oxidoreductase subunit A
MLIRIKKGLDIPISGAPRQEISEGPPVSSVALLGQDYLGVRPTLLVEEGNRVKLGQPLFADRKRPEIVFTSPGSGVVSQISRGERRALRSVVVELQGDEAERFSCYPADRLAQLRRDQVVDNLLASGLWTAFRTRPYSKIPEPGAEPRSMFVTAIDSSPLAADPGVVIGAGQGAGRQDFANGLTIISRLTSGAVFLCKEPGADIPLGDPARITVAEFAGPHPAGLAGTHIHFLDPVGAGKSVWHVNYQDVTAIGRLFTSGRLSVERIVALGGPVVGRPRLLRTRLGANIDELIRDETAKVACRVVSGSALSGHRAAGPTAFLGRYHGQITVLAEGQGDRYVVGGALGALGARSRAYGLGTALHGRPSTMLPVEAYERVMPLDVLPVPLLRALMVGDTDSAQLLGCLELDEEDMALCTFVCPGKQEYGPLLRASLTRIEREG